MITEENWYSKILLSASIKNIISPNYVLVAKKINKKIVCGESKESLGGIAYSVEVTSKEDERQ